MRKLHSNQEHAAMRALTGQCEVMYRSPNNGGDGTWWVDIRDVEVCDGKFLTSMNQAGKTSTAAINECFRQLTQLPEGHFVVTHAYDPARRRELLWNGFMWADRRKP